MCGRVIVDYDEMIPVASDSELAEWVSGTPIGAASSWNVKPTQPVPVALTSAKTRERRFELAHWSLVPPWARNLSQKYPTFNARAETLSERRTFAPALKHQRCAVVVSGFYEWTGPKQARLPHAVFGPRPMLLMAGLYSWWRDPGAAAGEGWHLTTTVVTRASAGAMATLHDRMPVLLGSTLLADWLDPDSKGDQSLVDAVSEASVQLAKDLRTYAVHPLRGDGPELILPI